MTDELVECPSEAHELDLGFNPTTQTAYGPGHHECDLCNGEQWVTKEVYDAEMEYREECRIRMLKYEEDRRRWAEEKKVIDALKNSKGIVIDSH